MVLFWLYHRGHHVVSLVGGATAQVGDPSGRLTSRATTADAAIQSNFESMFAQMGGLWENVIRYGKRHGQDRKGVGTQEVLNNAQWLDNLNILFFLKTLGNGARLGAMLGRET
jgi:tyrosyl-tRNA synthetase